MFGSLVTGEQDSKVPRPTEDKTPFGSNDKK